MKIRDLERYSVVVHLRDTGPSLKGVLFDANKDSLMLKHATHLDSDSELEGEVLIPRERVEFIQRVPSS